MQVLPDPTLSEVQDAAARIAPHVHRTPVLTCETISNQVGAQLFFKCENFQKVGAFKYRGATNAVQQLNSSAIERGVATHSSGNHAQALALAAKVRGAPAHIVMPKNAPQVKIQAVQGYGAEVVFCEPTLEARETTLDEVVARTGATFIHPYDNREVIAGQGTAALELIGETPELDLVIAPVGGGGLLSGTALATKGLSQQTKVIAAEPEGADDAYRSFRDGRLYPSVAPQTIADGLLTALCELTFRIIRQHVDDIVTVGEESIIAAMRLVWERAKIVIEPSAAVTLAALLEGKIDVRGKRIGLIFSGGNVDLERLPWSVVGSQT